MTPKRAQRKDGWEGMEWLQGDRLSHVVDMIVRVLRLVSFRETLAEEPAVAKLSLTQHTDYAEFVSARRK